MHVSSDEVGFVHAMHLTPANVSEVTQLEQVLGELRPSRVFADTGYASKANLGMLKSKGIKNGICYKGAGRHTLSRWQRRFNSLVCKSRWRVEQVFGTTKRRFQFTRTRYMGLRKVELEGSLQAHCLQRAEGYSTMFFRLLGRSLA